jgi:transposase
VKNKKVVISPPERRELSRRVRSRSIGAEDARRAQVILALGSGLGVRAVAGMLRCSSSYVQRWRERFLTSRLGGLVARHQGRKVRPDAAKLEARILE